MSRVRGLPSRKRRAGETRRRATPETKGTSCLEFQSQLLGGRGDTGFSPQMLQARSRRLAGR